MNRGGMLVGFEESLMQYAGYHGHSVYRDDWLEGKRSAFQASSKQIAVTTEPDRTDRLAHCRKRARFRAWHRGTRELDLVLGRFADDHVATMSETELAQFEALMDVEDGKLQEWLANPFSVADGHDNGICRAIVAFHLGRSQATHSGRK